MAVSATDSPWREYGQQLDCVHVDQSSADLRVQIHFRTSPCPCPLNSDIHRIILLRLKWKPKFFIRVYSCAINSIQWVIQKWVIFNSQRHFYRCSTKLKIREIKNMESENNQNHGHKLIKLTHKERLILQVGRLPPMEKLNILTKTFV